MCHSTVFAAEKPASQPITAGRVCQHFLGLVGRNHNRINSWITGGIVEEYQYMGLSQCGFKGYYGIPGLLQPEHNFPHDFRKPQWPKTGRLNR